MNEKTNERMIDEIDAVLAYDIAEIQAALAAGTLTVAGLVARCLARIAAVDRSGPALHAVLETNPEARAIAEQLAAAGPGGLLHGVPILLKDNIDTGDRMATTAGSLALAGARAARDATIVARLRAAGAVILGKTNLSEWANFRSSHSISGWSSLGGQTRNPYALDRNPCGSSSGSAVAVAANMCPVAIATETDGSIVCPAAVNGIVGIKPTVGLVSRAGIVPIAHSQDTAGPMARSVRDAALVLGVLAGTDPADPATAAGAGRAHSDYTHFLDTEGLRGARIGVARNFCGRHPAVDALFEDALAMLRSLGAEIVDPAPIATAGQLDEHEMTVLLTEFKHDLNAYLAGRGPDAAVHSLEELIAFNERNRERVMPFFGQELLLQAQEKGPLSDAAYLEALAAGRRLAREQGIDAALQAQHLDALVAPGNAPAWLTDPVNGDCYSGGSSTPAAVAGYPLVTVPAGQVHGLPVGLSFMGTAFAEPVLLRLAYAYEQATHHLRPPQFLASVI